MSKGVAQRRRTDGKKREGQGLVRGLYAVEQGCDNFFKERGMPTGQANPAILFGSKERAKRRVTRWDRAKADKLDKIVEDMGQA